VIRFNVKPLMLLQPETSVPIFDDEVWRTLSSTRDFEPGTSGWTGQFRSSLRKLDDSDGDFLLRRLGAQAETPQEYPFTDSAIGYITPREAEEAFYARLKASEKAA
jgi:hypothetical protein